MRVCEYFQSCSLDHQTGMCLGHRGTTVLEYSAQNPHGYVNNYPFIPA